MIEKASNRTEKLGFERLKDFITKRKYAVLKQVPTSIPLKTTMEKLNLEFKEIKKLYDFKIKAI